MLRSVLLLALLFTFDGSAYARSPCSSHGAALDDAKDFARVEHWLRVRGSPSQFSAAIAHDLGFGAKKLQLIAVNEIFDGEARYTAAVPADTSSRCLFLMWYDRGKSAAKKRGTRFLWEVSQTGRVVRTITILHGTKYVQKRLRQPTRYEETKRHFFERAE